jgi:uncharacterized coiled-coil protein SlyX
MGHVPITELEAYVARSERDANELTLVLAELGHRKTKRSLELRSLVQRLLRNLAVE